MARPSSITEFRPARPNRGFIRLMRLVNRLYALPRARVCREIRGFEILRSLPPGVMITPNHSDYTDAMVVTELMRRAGRFATFMATRETFDVHIGQVMGPYQYRPGGPYPNQRPVRWLKNLPRTHFSQGALYELGSAMSFFQ